MNQNRDAMHAAGGAVFAGQLSAERVTPPAQTQRKKVVLSGKDDYKLVSWLHNRIPVYMETHADIFAQCSSLGIDGLNIDHIRNRMELHRETLPVASAPVTPETRIDRLERMLAMILLGIKSGTYKQEVMAELVAFRREILGE